MKRPLAMILAALTMLLTAGCAGFSGGDSKEEPLEIESQTWTLVAGGSKSATWKDAADYFADQISQATNGTVTVTVQAEEDLPEGTTGLQAVRNGTASLYLSSNTDYAQLDQRLNVVNLPFLFPSEEAAETLLDGAGGQALDGVLAEYGLHCIGIGEEGFRYPTNRVRAITCVEDMKGLRIRVAGSEEISRAYRLWGADVVEAAWPLVYTALQTGTYDGQEMPLVTANAASIQDVQSYLTRWTGIYGCLYFCMNQELYASLSPTLQDIVSDCGQKTAQEQRQKNRQEESDILQSWKKVQITELTEDAAQAFRDAVQPCYDQFARSVDAELLKVFTDGAVSSEK